MKKQAIKHFKVIESTSTRLVVELTPTLRLYGQRHSDRRDGSSVWETRIWKFAKWKVFDNPFDRKDSRIVEEWNPIKANLFHGVKLAQAWLYKADIIAALNSVPEPQILL